MESLDLIYDSVLLVSVVIVSDKFLRYGLEVDKSDVYLLQPCRRSQLQHVKVISNLLEEMQSKLKGSKNSLKI